MELQDARVLAFGTAGAQGTGLVEAIADRGAVAVRVSTSAERAARWGGVVADLLHPPSVAVLAARADAAVLHVPLAAGAPDAGAAVLASVVALREHGLPVAVNLGTPVPPAGAPDPFGARGRAEALLGVGATVLTPTAYLENHAAPWALGPIADGTLVYPRPAGDPLAWIAAADVTAAAVAALTVDVPGELLVLAGPRPLTFSELATELGAGLGRPLRFRRVSAREYGSLLEPVVGPGAAAGVTAAYSAMPEGPNPVMTPDATATWTRLGLRPTPARTWAATTLAPALVAVSGSR